MERMTHAYSSSGWPISRYVLQHRRADSALSYDRPCRGNGPAGIDWGGRRVQRRRGCAQIRRGEDYDLSALADPRSLVLDACAGLDDRYDLPPDTGTLHGDLRTFVADLVRMVEQAGWAAVLPSIVDAAERNAAFADMHAQIQKKGGHASLVSQIAERAIGRGELPAETDTALLASTVLGPVFYRRWFSREPFDAAFIDAVTTRAIRGAQGSD